LKETEFAYLRKQKLKKTQKQMAQLLGTSIQAIYSYEQGWRSIPPHAERQLLFLVSKAQDDGNKKPPCWTLTKCPTSQKLQCPAYEFKAGDLCWLINGTFCDGTAQKDWCDKMKICRNCKVFSHLMK
jgi:hypothetical protein